MKKGTKLPVDYEYRRKGFTCKRTEKFTGFKKIEQGTKIYHYSDHIIKGFEPIDLCCYPQKMKIDGHVYCIIIRKPVIVETYGYNEYRIDLYENCIAENNIDIYYIGKIEMKRTDEKYEYRPGRWTWKYHAIDNTIEIEQGKGFNQTPLDSNERFSFLDYQPAHRTEKYYPVKHVISFKLDNLPTKDEFLSYFKENEEDLEEWI